MDKWIYPFFDGRRVADVNNRAMRDFVDHISTLAPATVRDYSNIVKAVVASALNDQGEQLFPRTWNEEFIDAPLIGRQNQPSTDSEGMQAILAEATGQLASYMPSSRGPVLYEPARRLGLRLASTSPMTAALFTSGRRPNGESSKTT